MTIHSEKNASSLSPVLLVLRLLGPLALIVFVFIYFEDIRGAFRQSMTIGTKFLLLFPLFFVWNHVAALGWKRVIPCDEKFPRIRAWRLALIRYTAQSVNMVVPFSVGTPILKSYFLAKVNNDLKKSAASVVVDTATATAMEVLLSIIVLACFQNWFSANKLYLNILFLTPCILIPVSIVLVTLLRSNAPRFRYLKQKLFSHSFWHLNEYCPTRSNLGICALAHFLEQLLMVSEIWLISYWMGISLNVTQVLWVTAIMNSFSFVLFFLPGRIGAIEGGIAAAFSMLGFPVSLGLSVGLIRRARQISVYGIGLMTLFASGNLFAFRQSSNNDSIRTIIEGSYGKK